MPQIGWLEILIIVSIAIIVVGPKDFPLMLKKMGSWIGSIKRYVSDVQTQVSEITDSSIEDEKSLAGVPVFNLPRVKPNFFNVVEIPLEGGSPTLPPGVVFLPQCIMPFKKVPVVKTV